MKVVIDTNVWIPDGKYERLKNYAKSKKISLNKLFDEMATVALAQYDAKVQFEMMSRRGSKKKGLELLDKIDESINNR